MSVKLNELNEEFPSLTSITSADGSEKLPSFSLTAIPLNFNFAYQTLVSLSIDGSVIIWLLFSVKFNNFEVVEMMHNKRMTLFLVAAKKQINMPIDGEANNIKLDKVRLS